MIKFSGALVATFLASTAFAQVAEPAPAPAKPQYQRVCTTQAITGGLIRKQKICSRVPVAASSTPAPAPAAIASAPEPAPQAGAN